MCARSDNGCFLDRDPWTVTNDIGMAAIRAGATLTSMDSIPVDLRYSACLVALDDLREAVRDLRLITARVGPEADTVEAYHAQMQALRAQREVLS